MPDGEHIQYDFKQHLIICTRCGVEVKWNLGLATLTEMIEGLMRIRREHGNCVKLT